MPNPKFHVVIVGAGLGGLAASIGISRAGHEVTILEQAAQLGEIGAGVQIPPNSSRILKRWGVLPAIESHSTAPQDIKIRSYRDGQVLQSQPLLPYCNETYGAPYLVIHRADFHAVLVEAAQKEGVQIQLGSSVTSIDFTTPRVHVRDKPSVDADIIIGADGLKSICREEMLGKKDPPHLTGDLAYRITVKVEDMRKHKDLVELADNQEINIWMGPDSHVVSYMLKGGGLYNIVLVCPDNLPELVSTAKADLQEMRDFFENWDPQLKLILGMVQETSKWRLQNSHEMYRWSHPSGKFALMGDACHATLPYLAQGAAMAVEDGAVLGALFSQIAHPSQLKDLLLIYERIRKQRTTKVVTGSTHARDIYHCPDGDVQQERDRQFREEAPFEGFPNRFSDPAFQPWLYGYDAYREADDAWATYLRGRFPGTTTRFRAGL
ncbi:hypothetical protein MMC11_003954 [Xylographa trunciseda]|nr:hypothetical protein [Xylographa trunciseda]